MKNHLAIATISSLLFTGVAFASPLTGLSAAEQSYHDKIFDYVMDTVNPDNSYDWASYSGKGTIKVGAPFVSKSNSNCREFTEDYTVQGIIGASKGYGCRRSDGDGWCRLKKDAALTCALEQPAYSVGGGSVNVPTPSVGSPNVQIGNVSGPNINVNINTPNVDTSNVHAPNLSSGNNNKNNNQNNNTSQSKPKPDVAPGSASGTAYSVTDTLGSGAAKGTGMAVGWFKDMFR